MHPKTKRHGFFLVLGLAVFPGFAHAGSIILSGDVNIANALNGSANAPVAAGNQRFFENVLGSGTRVAVRSGAIASADRAVNDFYNSIPGVSSSLITTIDSGTLQDVDLFLVLINFSFPPPFTSGELGAMSDLLARGGSLFFLGGESSSAFNDALTALGSNLRFANGATPGLFHYISGDDIIQNDLTSGVSSLATAFGREVFLPPSCDQRPPWLPPCLPPGTDAGYLFRDVVPFVAYETYPPAKPVPEPASAALFSLGLLTVTRRLPKRWQF